MDKENIVKPFGDTVITYKPPVPKYLIRIENDKGEILLTMYLDGTITAVDEVSATEAGKVFFEHISYLLGTLVKQSRNEGITKAIEALDKIGALDTDISMLTRLEALKE
jgi:hypothetical protein